MYCNTYIDSNISSLMIEYKLVRNLDELNELGQLKKNVFYKELESFNNVELNGQSKFYTDWGPIFIKHMHL